MEQNNLLNDVVKHNQRMPKGYAGKSQEDQELDRQHVHQRKIEALKKTIMEESIFATDDSLCSLLRCQEFFAASRHSVVHLPETAAKVNILVHPYLLAFICITSLFTSVVDSGLPFLLSASLVNQQA